MTVTSGGGEGEPEIVEVGKALSKLARHQPDLAVALARLVVVVTEEATRNPRFSDALQRTTLQANTGVPSREHKVRRGRRNPGVMDPFVAYAAEGEEGLRTRLGALSLDQLRDIVAEHGMDHDRLAMKWKDPLRVIDRIVERVSARAAKGSAFRSKRGTP